MKIKPKYLIIGGVAILAVALMSFGKAKVAQAKEVFDKIIIKLGSIHSGKIVNSNLRVLFDISLENPTATDFTASGSGMIAGKGYRILTNGKVLAHGTLNHLNKVNLPAFGRYQFKDISLEIPLMSLGSELLGGGGGITDILSSVSNAFSGGLKNELESKKNYVMNLFTNATYEVDFEAFGLIYTFKGKVM